MDLEKQLRAALVPTSPRPQVRAAVLERLAAGSGRRGPNRWVLGGVVLAVAAATAMLAMQLRQPVAPVAVVDSNFPPDVLGTSSDMPAAPLAADPATVARDTQPQPQVIAPSITPFTVQVLPLKNDVVDMPRKVAIDAVYAAFVDGLRAVPGLTLVGPPKDGTPVVTERDGFGAPLSTNYRLTLEGGVARGSAAGAYFVEVAAERAGRDGRKAGALYWTSAGEVAPGCASPTSIDVLAGDKRCADPAGVAAELIATLRKTVFPPDPQLQQRVQARLVDHALAPEERLRALADLASFGFASGTNARNTFPPALRDPAVIRAAIQLGSTAPEPATRAQVWYTLRGSRDPELVSPLVAALRADTDEDTRLQALGTLAADLATDPQVRLALEAAAARDSDSMVRALAGRALGAEAGWTEYVLGSLKDTARSPVERIKALFHAYGLPTSRAYGSFDADGRILRALDDSAMRALAEVLPKAAADSQVYARASHTLVSELAYLKHPAITDMLLDGLSAGNLWLDRGFAFRSLNSSGDPRARAALEKIAGEDVDPEVRELARDALKQPSFNQPANGSLNPAPGPLPPRLGVMTDYVQPGPDVRAELVGKLVVTRMATGLPGERAGMKEGDIVLEIGGKAITSGPQLLEVLDGVPRDVDVEVLVFRNGETMRLVARF